MPYSPPSKPNHHRNPQATASPLRHRLPALLPAHRHDKVPGPDPQMCVAASITAKAKRPLYGSENEGFALLGGEVVVWAVREAQLVALDREMDVVEEEEMRVVREGREGIWDVGE